MFDIEAVRAGFPALARPDAPIFLDNPAGTQIAGRAIDRMVNAMVETNANLGGAFATSIAAGALVDEAHAAMTDFLGAGSRQEIVFGQNMTTLTFAVSRAIGRTLKAGDAIVLTRMDHDANVAPWLMLAEDLGLEVRWIDFDPESFEFDLSRLGEVLTPGVKLVATGYASNVTGTIHDVAAIARAAKAVGALTFVDAVQFAPHGLIDVQAIGCDLLVCSAYKFYGPHQGILWGRHDLLEALDAYKVRPAPSAPPGKFESGTTSREALAGVLGAVEHFESLGVGATRRERIASGIAAAEAYERALTERLIDGLEALPGVRIIGLTARQAMARRVPTVSFVADGRAPAGIAKAMAEANISLWSGHNYGIEPIARLGLADKGGVVRIGLGHYNTAAEVDRLIEVLGAELQR